MNETIIPIHVANLKGAVVVLDIPSRLRLSSRRRLNDDSPSARSAVE